MENLNNDEYVENLQTLENAEDIKKKVVEKEKKIKTKANQVKRNFSKLSLKFSLNKDLTKSGKKVSVTNGKTIK